MNRQKLGNIGEARVLAHLLLQDYYVFMPFSDNGPVDMIALKDNVTYKISVKGTSTQNKSGSWQIELRTVSRRKDNTCKITKFDSSTCDILAIYIEPLDKIVLIDTKTIEAKSAISIKI